MDTPIPAEPDELTPAWLTAALRSTGVLTQTSVAELSVEIIGQEWGFTGIVSRVHPTYDQLDTGAPATLVAKFPNATGDTISTYRKTQQRDPVAAQRYFERCAREVWFYQRVTGLMPALTPQMYYGATDLTAGRFILLLEDLGHMRTGDALRGCSANDAEAVLQAMAPLHAHWWGGGADTDLSWAPGWRGDPAARHERYNERVGPFLARFGDRIPDEVHELTRRLRPVYRDVIMELSGAPSTLIHADLHLDNVLFGPDGNALVIDWQTISQGPAAWDVAYLLFGSLDTVTRRGSERELVRGYHELLVRHGVQDYSREQLWHHLRLSLLCLLAGHVNWFATVDLSSLAGRELALFNAVIDDGWLFTAMLDHNVAEILP